MEQKYGKSYLESMYRQSDHYVTIFVFNHK